MQFYNIFYRQITLIAVYRSLSVTRENKMLQICKDGLVKDVRLALHPIFAYRKGKNTMKVFFCVI